MVKTNGLTDTEWKDYLIEIKDEKWSCIITIEPGK